MSDMCVCHGDLIGQRNRRERGRREGDLRANGRHRRRACRRAARRRRRLYAAGRHAGPTLASRGHRGVRPPRRCISCRCGGDDPRRLLRTRGRTQRTRDIRERAQPLPARRRASPALVATWSWGRANRSQAVLRGERVLPSRHSAASALLDADATLRSSSRSRARSSGRSGTQKRKPDRIANPPVMESCAHATGVSSRGFVCQGDVGRVARSRPGTARESDLPRRSNVSSDLGAAGRRD